LVSEASHSDTVKFEIELLDFYGKLVEKDEVVFDITADTRDLFVALPKENYSDNNLKELVLSVSCIMQNGKKTNALYYFVKPKDLQLTKPYIQIDKIDELTYEISSDVLAKNVFLSSEEDAFFSDNYFDMLPNQKIKINLSKPVKAIAVKSLFDVMNN
jgi:beta-mannosidase